MAAETMAEMPVAAVIVGHGHAEVELDVRHREVRIGLEKAAAFGDIRGDHADAVTPVAPDLRPEMAKSRERHAEIVQALRTVTEGIVDMVLQVLADAGRMMHDIDADALQIRRVADA